MIYIIEFMVAAIATVSFAILFSAPRKELLLCGFVGALGWLVYLLMTKHGVHLVAASAVATGILTIFARALAVLRKMPVTVYLLTGIFPLVPGAAIYYTAYYLFIGDTAMSSVKAIETFEVAGAIVLGIIFGFSIPQRLFGKLLNFLG